ncbi:hypothetical protein CHARACLAT_033117 [Characodon lateralis]|uniref:Uncharacterized protein n=1 Tax=Characodon lateralis TaxID=208331 RepID=A0ABU7DWF6_9TELE|nr:hypothetical protein [Characodon lateralis]
MINQFSLFRYFRLTYFLFCMKDVKVVQMNILNTLIISPTKTWRVKNQVGSDSDAFDSSDLDAEPQISQMNPGQQKAAIKGQNISWRKKTFEPPECTSKGPCAKPDQIHTPLEYFRKYSVQKSNSHRNLNTTVKELETLIGLYLHMGLWQIP